MGDAEDNGPEEEPDGPATDPGGVPEPLVLTEIAPPSQPPDPQPATPSALLDPPDDDDEPDIVTLPGQRAVTAFDLGGDQHEVSHPGDRDLPSVRSATSIPAIVTPEEPDADISTSPSQRAVTAFDLGDSDHALKMPAPPPAPWTPTAESIAVRLEKAGVVTTGDHALPEDDVEGGGEDDAPELVKPVYVKQTDPDEEQERAISRRRFIARAGAAVLAAGVGLHAWGRRPMPGGDLGYRPSVFEDGSFRTLFRAFEALLGGEEDAARAASQADLHFARYGAGPRDALVADLSLLELGPRGLLDSRRFSRLDPERAAAVLERWRTSPVQARRRVHADLTRLARHCWATHPATLEGGG